jgi:hypothetical protein
MPRQKRRKSLAEEQWADAWKEIEKALGYLLIPLDAVQTIFKGHRARPTGLIALTGGAHEFVRELLSCLKSQRLPRTASLYGWTMYGKVDAEVVGKLYGKWPEGIVAVEWEHVIEMLIDMVRVLEFAIESAGKKAKKASVRLEDAGRRLHVACDQLRRARRRLLREELPLKSPAR